MSSAGHTPLVTVITSTYNSRATLLQAVRTVVRQDFQDFEYLVIGDGCTDDSGQVVASFNDPRLAWHNLPANSGSQTKPNNEGLRRARGRYVAFLGHDDLWLPWHLSSLVRHIGQTEADLVHDLSVNLGPEGVLDANGPPHELENYDWVYFPTSSWLHRRELVQEVGGWNDPDTLCWPIDYDFTRRLSRAGKRIEFLSSLGVLKLPSLCWKNYAPGAPGEARQKFLEELERSPQEFARRLLLELAVRHAQITQLGGRQPLQRAWADFVKATRGFARAAIRHGVELYGPDRWPLGPLLRQRFRNVRLKNRLRRGLPK